MWIVAPGWFDDLVAPGRELRRSANGVLSALSSHEGGSRYDGRAALYDRLVSNSFYNRRVWRSSVASYATFAAAAVASGDGPMLDVGCGTAVFTADAYRVAERPLVLVDRSLGMLTRAAQRLELRSQDSSRIVLVQADLLDLPFRPASFSTVASFGVLHLFADVVTVLDRLQAQLAPGGSLYATSLVSQTAISKGVLMLLHLGGEAASPRRASELEVLAGSALGDEFSLRTEGSMAFLSYHPRAR